VGKAACLALAKCGADVIAADVHECKETVAAIRSMGRTAEFVHCDVRDRLAVDEAFAHVEK
jgi:NAD(P)-dependent dehydrogenase (short-subunit alcohol dehydrogenase family)